MITRRQFLQSTIGTVAAASLLPLVPAGAAPDPWLDAALQPGDVLTIPGVFAINPVTYKTTEYLQQFVVTKVQENGTVDLCPSFSNRSSKPNILGTRARSTGL